MISGPDERAPGAVDDARQDVSAKVVGAKPKRGVRADGAVDQALLRGRSRGEPRRNDGDNGEQHEGPEAEPPERADGPTSLLRTASADRSASIW